MMTQEPIDAAAVEEHNIDKHIARRALRANITSLPPNCFSELHHVRMVCPPKCDFRKIKGWKLSPMRVRGEIVAWSIQ